MSDTHAFDPAPSAPAVILCVGADRDALAALRESLSGTDYEVRTATPPVGVSALEDADCVVCGPTATRQEGADVLATLESRAPLPLPLVLCTDGRSETTGFEATTDRAEVVVLEADDGTLFDRLPPVVDALVGAAQAQTIARRALAALETSPDGFAIVEPGGTFEFVDRTYAVRFGYTPGALLGRPWQVCFPEEEAERLRSDALPSVRANWQWLGGCVGRRADGESFSAELRLCGLEDRSLVFCLSGNPDD